MPPPAAPSRIPEHLLAEIRARLPIAALVGRHVALKRSGARWLTGLCPFHAERTPSFAVKPAENTFHCFGCGAHGDVIGFVMRREGLDFRAAAARCAAEAGVLLDAPGAAGIAPWRIPSAPPPGPPLGRAASPDPATDRASRIAMARRIWDRTAPIAADGPVAHYLRGRGLWPLPAPAHAVLRQARLRHKDTGPDVLHPCMVARVDGPDGGLCAVHRTYLAPRDGGGWGKLGGVADAKVALGPLPGGAIRLFPVAAQLGLAEGIETALAAHALSGEPVWAAIAASILALVDPPFDVGRITVYADRDRPRPELGQPEGAGVAAARALQRRLRGQAVDVAIRTPVPPHCDYADMLAARLGLAA